VLRRFRIVRAGFKTDLAAAATFGRYVSNPQNWVAAFPQIPTHIQKSASFWGFFRSLAGTHQGGVSHEHLPYYLDEFTFRSNRRKSKSRGKLFFRLVQQAVDTGPTTYTHIANPSKARSAANHNLQGLPEPSAYPVCEISCRYLPPLRTVELIPAPPARNQLFPVRLYQ
jgi:hypothetical protein